MTDMNQTLIAAAVAAFLGALGTWKVMDWRYDAREAQIVTERAAALKEAQDYAISIDAGYQQVVAWLNEQRRGRTVEIIRELEKPVYRDCVLPESGRLLINSAISQANAARIGGSVLPETSVSAGSSEPRDATSAHGLDVGTLRRMFGWQSGADKVGD